jgi:hypothetical protein
MIGQRKMLLNVIEIWFCLHVREQLAFIGRYSLQKYREMRKPFQEAFVIVGVIIISSLMQTLEAPTKIWRVKVSYLLCPKYLGTTSRIRSSLLCIFHTLPCGWTKMKLERENDADRGDEIKQNYYPESQVTLTIHEMICLSRVTI